MRILAPGQPLLASHQAVACLALAADVTISTGGPISPIHTFAGSSATSLALAIAVNAIWSQLVVAIVLLSVGTLELHGLSGDAVRRGIGVRKVVWITARPVLVLGTSRLENKGSVFAEQGLAPSTMWQLQN